MYYGYHRVSTKQQHLDRGIEAIKEFCKERNYPLEKIFTDKISGKSFDRPRYLVLKEDVLRKGDTLIIHELDRLARTKKGIAEELAYFDKIGVRVMVLNIPTTLIDLSTVPEYTSNPYVEINNNIPYFTDKDYTTKSFEKYSEWDDLGRSGVAFANVCKETMPKEGEERGDIGSVKNLSGWVQKRYDNLIKEVMKRIPEGKAKNTFMELVKKEK